MLSLPPDVPAGKTPAVNPGAVPQISCPPEHGALLFGEGKIFSAPALPLEEVFDPTGAGDTFAGGFVGYLAKVGTINFNNLKNAIIYGSALASFCVEKFGPEKRMACVCGEGGVEVSGPPLPLLY